MATPSGPRGDPAIITMKYEVEQKHLIEDIAQFEQELVERGIFLVGLWFSLLLGLRRFAVGTLGRAVLDAPAALAYAVADIAYRVEPAHVLLLQEIDGIAVALGKQSDQRVGPGHGVVAG